MALNFPDPATQTPVNTWSPTSTPSASTNGLTYLWDGAKWTTEDGVPNLHWTRAGSVLSPTNAGDDVQIASLNSGPLAGFRNQIINGNVIVRQRAETTANSYVADRWFTATAGCGTANTGPDGVGLKRVITIPAAGGFIRQALELDNPNRQSQFAPASTWTARVWATSQPRLRLSFRKTSDDITDQSEIFAFTDMTAGRTVDGFTEYTHTITIPDVTANVQTNQLQTLVIWFQSDGAAASFTGMSFEPGPVATPFEQRPIGTELALCQRYYQRIQSTVGATKVTRFSGIWRNTTTARIVVPFYVPMRAAPTFNSSGVFEAMYGSSFSVTTGLTMQSGDQYSAALDATITPGPSSGGGGAALRFDNGAVSSTSFDAEL